METGSYRPGAVCRAQDSPALRYALMQLTPSNKMVARAYFLMRELIFLSTWTIYIEL